MPLTRHPDDCLHYVGVVSICKLCADQTAPVQVGLKIEEKGLKASRDSDQAVRDAYFSAAERANSVSGSGSEKAQRGKVFSQIIAACYTS